MIRFILSIFLVSILVNNTFAKEVLDEKLVKKLEALTDDFNGDVGIYVHHLKTNQKAAIRADELFPTASMIKLPILITIFNKMEQGELNYSDKYVYDDSLLYEGDDILGSFKSGEEITLSRLVMLMITMSDNTASLWLQQLAGTGTDINAYMEQLGFPGTQVNSRTKGRKLDYQKYGWGQTTPRELAELLVRIRNGAIVSQSASEEMYRVLCNIYWNSEALSQIPPYVQAASKSGAVNESRSEIVLVNAPSGDYVFCVITKNQQDTSWGYENEGFVLLREVSKLLWQYFEADHEWQPTEPKRWNK
jgi:beta-lactamase class A